MYSFKNFVFFTSQDKIVVSIIVLIIFIIGSSKLKKIDRSYRNATFSYAVYKHRKKLEASIEAFKSKSYLNQQQQINKKHAFGLLIDINTASQKDFEKLPNIGPVYASRIIEYRKSVGKFQNIDELIKIKGIGKKRLQKLRPHITISN